MLLKSLFRVLVVIWASSSVAADVDLLFADGDYAQIIIQGPITKGDGAKFYELSERYSSASVALDSPGGNVMEALSIGSEIRLRGFTTFVAGGKMQCYSACALIWIAGVRRYMKPDASIGVHAAYEMVTGEGGTDEARESGVGNAQIGAYLNELGLSAKAIGFFTMAAPDSFEYITPAVAQFLDIDVFVQDAAGFQTPAERPTPRRVADRASRLLSVSVWCAPILDLSSKPIEIQGSGVLREGHEIFGGEVFAPLIVEYMDRRKQELEEMGKPAWCIEAVDRILNSSSMVAGLSGPSFDCNRATTASEKTICATPALWARDRMLSAAYRYFEDVLSIEEFARVRRNQVSWLQRRQECGASTECVIRAYEARYWEMGLFQR